MLNLREGNFRVNVYHNEFLWSEAKSTMKEQRKITVCQSIDSFSVIVKPYTTHATTLHPAGNPRAVTGGYRRPASYLP